MMIHLVTDRLSLGGGLEHLFQLCKGLPHLRFRVFGNQGNAREKLITLPNVEIRDQGFSPRQILAGNPDLIHIHQIRPLFSLFNNPWARYKIPILYTAHGLHLRKYQYLPSWKSPLLYRLRFQLEKTVMRKCRQILAVSREDQDFLQKSYQLPNVTYLTNGIDPLPIQALTDSPLQLREQLGLPSDTFILTTVARFNFQKGYDILLKAIHSLKTEIQDQKLLFLWIGDGETFPFIQQQVHRLGLTPQVALWGKRTDIYPIIKASDALILPSRWEGLPIVLLEAGLLKTPVIASNATGNRELLEGGAGILFENQQVSELAEAIRGVIQKKFPLEKYKNCLYQKVCQEYQLPTMLQGLEKIYQQCLSEPFHG